MTTWGGVALNVDIWGATYEFKWGAVSALGCYNRDT